MEASLIGIGIISMTPAAAALLTPALRRLPKTAYGWLVGGFVGVLFAAMLGYLPYVTELGALEWVVPWVPQLGLTLGVYLDGLALLFSLVILGIGAMIAVYAGYYFETSAELSRFYRLLLAFMSAMLALVLAGNLITLFIAWEATSLLSFLLISFNGERDAARSGALQALMITAGGGLALLVGLVLMGTEAGTMGLSEIVANVALRESPLYGAFTVLILIGCFSKSAQFPFHFWLPGAMSAPTPASAYLHSATMVKAGIYLLMRFAPTLGDTALWETALVGIGLLTLLMGAAFALRQRDLKAGLAYATISQLGAIVALVGLPNGEGTQAALITILAHGLYKAALFMVAGAVDHTTGTRDLNKLGGLFKPMRGWAIVSVIAGISMAGLPPMLGFVAKEGLLEAMHASPLALAVIVVSAALTVTMALILTRDVFWGAAKGDHHHLHLTPNAMLFGPAVLAVGSLVTGLALEPLITPLLVPFFGPDLHLYLFHGINLPLILSTIAIIAGVVVFALRDTWRGWAWFGLPQGAKIYAGIMGGVERVGDLLLRVQGGKLRYYLVVILITVIGLQATAGLGHLSIDTLQFPFDPTTDILRTILLAMALGAVFASVITRNHLLAALALGMSGYAIGGLFLVEPAPDVALVQFMVETVGTVLLVVMLSRIRADQRQQAMNTIREQTQTGLLRDVAISLAIGAAVGVFALAAMESRPKPESIATWHIQNAGMIGVPDVVGAIVTDFRGMDTLVEISVFSVAALGVLTMLTTRRRTNISQVSVIEGETADASVMRHDVSEADEEEETLLLSRFSTPLTRIMSQAVLPLAFVVSMVHLLYGGEQPGDGFTAGVISGLGVALSYIVFGYNDAQERLGWLRPRLLIGGGLVLVIINAAFPMLTGNSFLGHLSLEGVTLPAHLHLSTTLVYETGIFLTVLGSVSTIMEAIAYPREAEPL